MTEYRVELVEVRRRKNTGKGTRQAYETTGNKRTLPGTFSTRKQAEEAGKKAIHKAVNLVAWTKHGITWRWVIMTEEGREQ